MGFAKQLSSPSLQQLPKEEKKKIKHNIRRILRCQKIASEFELINKIRQMQEEEVDHGLLMTHDIVSIDNGGYVYFLGPKDPLITAPNYRMVRLLLLSACMQCYFCNTCGDVQTFITRIQDYVGKIFQKCTWPEKPNSYCENPKCEKKNYETYWDEFDMISNPWGYTDDDLYKLPLLHSKKENDAYFAKHIKTKDSEELTPEEEYRRSKAIFFAVIGGIRKVIAAVPSEESRVKGIGTYLFSCSQRESIAENPWLSFTRLVPHFVPLKMQAENLKKYFALYMDEIFRVYTTWGVTDIVLPLVAARYNELWGVNQELESHKENFLKNRMQRKRPKTAAEIDFRLKWEFSKLEVSIQEGKVDEEGKRNIVSVTLNYETESLEHEETKFWYSVRKTGETEINSSSDLSNPGGKPLLNQWMDTLGLAICYRYHLECAKRLAGPKQKLVQLRKDGKWTAHKNEFVTLESLNNMCRMQCPDDGTV